jgi:hypothetical protein
MKEDTGWAVRAGAPALQDIELPDGELEAILAAVERNAAAVSRLAPRIAFEDEPSLYVAVLERVKG